MKHTRFVFGFLICALVHTAHTAFAQGTTFTYQGRLGQGGAVANGLYDLRFALYDATNGGTAQGASLTNATVTVSNGLFAVPLDFGSGVFDGSPRWLEIGVRTNGSGAAHTILSPRQIVGSTPYAVRAGNFSGAISDSQLSGNIARLNSNVVFSGNVQFGTNLNGLRVAGGNLLNGLLYNSANGYGNFINGGTLDPQGTNAIIGGALNMIGGGKGNHIQGSSAVSISSGEQNRITNSSVSGIGSGNGNVLSGAIESYVGGGCLNRILDSRACGIPSGWGHTIRGDSWWSVIAGGSYCWMSSNNYCAISGGWTNRIEKSESSAIGGGYLNLIESANGATIDGGYANSIGGGAYYATIAGGHENTILTNGRWGTIAGGWQNTATNYAFAAGHRAKSIHTGAFVWADSANADFASTISNQFNVRAGGGIRLETGGAGATLDGQPVLAGYTFGSEITANNGLRLIDANIWFRNDSYHGLGWYGTGKPFALAAPDGPVLFGFGGGALGTSEWGDEKIALSWNSSGRVGVGTNSPAGQLHVASAGGSPQLQITQNITNDSARLRMNVAGSPSWEMDVGSGASPELSFRTFTKRMAIDYNGNVSATTFNPTSDRNTKENFEPVSAREVLNKVTALPLSRWNFKEDSGARHLGPMAQDFHAAFGLGADDKHIATVDADGVALAAIQGLNEKLEEKLRERDRQVMELKELVEKLAKKLDGTSTVFTNGNHL